MEASSTICQNSQKPFFKEHNLGGIAPAHCSSLKELYRLSTAPGRCLNNDDNDQQMERFFPLFQIVSMQWLETFQIFQIFVSQMVQI